jgi:MarR family transcriptional regulator, transcriptional regulator for hemolysin
MKKDKKVVLCETPFEIGFIYDIHQIYFLIGKNIEKKFSMEKVFTMSQYWVVHCIVECSADSKDSQVEIAKTMFVSEATISKHIEKLRDQKYLIREVDIHNRRKHILKITEKGKKIYEKAEKILNKELEKIFQNIKEKDKQIILKNFRQILININNNQI